MDKAELRISADAIEVLALHTFTSSTQYRTRHRPEDRTLGSLSASRARSATRLDHDAPVRSRIIPSGADQRGRRVMRQTWRRIWKRGVVAALALASTIGLAAGLPAPAALAQSGDVWGERAPMLLPRSEASVAELNGKIYVIGGYPGTRVTSDSVQV